MRIEGVSVMGGVIGDAVGGGGGRACVGSGGSVLSKACVVLGSRLVPCSGRS